MTIDCRVCHVCVHLSVYNEYIAMKGRNFAIWTTWTKCEDVLGEIESDIEKPNSVIIS